MTNKCKLIIILCASLIISVSSVFAYYTSTDRQINTFTVGSVDIELTEPLYDAESSEMRSALEPDSDVTKDPQVTNVGTNDAYVFIEVDIPRKDVITANKITGAKIDSRLQDLFTFNVGEDWVLVESDITNDSSKYVYGYVTNNALIKLEPNETTTVLFDDGKVHLINIVEGQGLEEKTFNIPINAYAIQTEDITADDLSDPLAVWNILSNQKGGLL